MFDVNIIALRILNDIHFLNVINNIAECRSTVNTLIEIKYLANGRNNIKENQ